MGSICRCVKSFHAAEGGETTVEWTLALVAFGLPMVYVFTLLLAILAEHYRMIAFLETLPFP